MRVSCAARISRGAGGFDLSEIVLEGVSKRWGETAAVDGVSLRVPAGSFVVLLGPSGCGKSTTLRLVAGLEAASSGRILIDGRDVTALPPAARGVSMVFQSYALFPHLSVAENIVFGLRVRRLSREERERRLERATALLGLGGLMDRKPSQLSGGQQQRVALGRAIVAETPVCLMDEPLSNLDAQLRQEMRREIRALQRQLGITLVYVTHDQVEAMTMADRVVLMRGGRVEQDASPAEIYARPATSFAARFIGTPPMNLARLADSPAGAVLRGSAGPALLPGRGDGLVAGVRPEAMRLVDATHHGALEAEVLSAEYLGADTGLACRVGEEQLSLRAPGQVTPAPGARVRIAVEPGSLHLFDAASGRRVEGGAATAP
jgi:sn-glycerol 3-phosphate transport system ATP-binding protein